MPFKPTIALSAAFTAAAFAATLALAGSCARDAHAPERAATPAAPPATPPAPPRPARPAVVLLRQAPWAGADADRPLFVLYDDGRVLLPRAGDGVLPSYRTARVDFSDPDSALARLGIGPDFFRLRPAYALDDAADPGQEALVLSVWRDGRLTRVAVGVRSLGRLTRLPDGTPRAFRDAYRAITAFRPRDAEEWRPARVEVVARPYDYAPDDPPLRWPRGWPGLASPGAAVRTGHAAVDTAWTIPLPYERLGELRRLLRRRRTKQAILIDGRKVAVGYRLALPGEEHWRGETPHLAP